MYRMILNETSYFGAGCREAIRGTERNVPQRDEVETCVTH